MRIIHQPNHQKPRSNSLFTWCFYFPAQEHTSLSLHSRRPFRPRRRSPVCPRAVRLTSPHGPARHGPCDGAWGWPFGRGIWGMGDVSWRDGQMPSTLRWFWVCTACVCGGVLRVPATSYVISSWRQIGRTRAVSGWAFRSLSLRWCRRGSFPRRSTSSAQVPSSLGTVAG